ncbi:MAG: DUF2158 domain-containing protein [Candidatus Sulfotelmatobacter sp.]
MKFFIGDIVQLKSGGPDMRVIDGDDENVIVEFLSQHTFPVPCVTRVFGQDQEFMGRQGLLGKARSLTLSAYSRRF